MKTFDSITKVPLTREQKLLFVIFLAIVGAVTIGVVVTIEPLLVIGGVLGAILLLVFFKMA